MTKESNKQSVVFAVEPSAHGARIPRWVQFALLVSGIAAIACSSAHACAPENEDSVHFNTNQPDFGAPPQRLSAGLTRYGDEYVLWKRLDTRARFETKARSAEKRGQWQNAANYYIRAIRFGDSGNYHDRIEIFRRLAGDKTHVYSPAFLVALQVYLSGMADIDSNPSLANTRFSQVYANPAADFLREHALYQQASEAFHMLDYHGAVKLYQRLLHEFPKTAKREEALIMLTRSALLPATEAGRDMTAGLLALSELSTHYARSRFRRAIVGLRARFLFLKGDLKAAAERYLDISDLASAETARKQMAVGERTSFTFRLLTAYLRRLPHVKSYSEYGTTIRLIDDACVDLNPDGTSRFLKGLAHDSDAASSYLAYRLFHFDRRPTDLKQLTQTAEEFALLHSPDQVPAPVTLRLAEIYYRRKQYRKSIVWAERACRTKVTDRSLFVRGGVREKLGNLRGGISDFEELLRQFPLSTIRRDARAELAILYEHAGNLNGALEQYYLLGYLMDAAFLLDARMSIPQVEACLHSSVGRSQHPVENLWRYGGDWATRRYPQHDLILYSLGIRYLRAAKWKAAVTALRQVPSRTFFEFGKGRREWASNPSPDPITTAQQLGKLQAAVTMTNGAEARARALFRYGLYYSQHGTLLLYNASLWNHEREAGFDLLWNTKAANNEDAFALHKHMYDHEVYSRSRAVLLEVARRYPHSTVAPAALYFAGYAARYLARFNGWWDKEDEKHHFWFESAHCMKQIVRQYPKSAFAKRARAYLTRFTMDRTLSLNAAPLSFSCC